MSDKNRELPRIVIFAAVSACLVSSFDTKLVEAASKRLYKGSVSASVLAADRMMMKGKYAAAATYYQAALTIPMPMSVMVWH